VGAIAVLATTAFASPAYADTTADLEVKLTGTTLSPGVDDKLGSLSVLNHGPSDVTGFTLTFDISALDDSKIAIDSTGCTTTADEVVCDGSGIPVKNGEDADFFFPFVKAAGATPGDAGDITVTVTHDGTDPTEGNNSVTVDVVITAAARAVTDQARSPTSRFLRAAPRTYGSSSSTRGTPLRTASSCRSICRSTSASPPRSRVTAPTPRATTQLSASTSRP
jgi:hypothetical protein